MQDTEDAKANLFSHFCYAQLGIQYAWIASIWGLSCISRSISSEFHIARIKNPREEKKESGLTPEAHAPRKLFIQTVLSLVISFLGETQLNGGQIWYKAHPWSPLFPTSNNFLPFFLSVRLIIVACVLRYLICAVSQCLFQYPSIQINANIPNYIRVASVNLTKSPSCKIDASFEANLYPFFCSQSLFLLRKKQTHISRSCQTQI